MLPPPPQKKEKKITIGHQANFWFESRDIFQKYESANIIEGIILKQFCIDKRYIETV